MLLSLLTALLIQTNVCLLMNVWRFTNVCRLSSASASELSLSTSSDSPRFTNVCRFSASAASSSRFTNVCLFPNSMYWFCLKRRSASTSAEFAARRSRTSSCSSAAATKATIAIAHTRRAVIVTVAERIVGVDCGRLRPGAASEIRNLWRRVHINVKKLWLEFFNRFSQMLKFLLRLTVLLIIILLYYFLPSV